MWEATSRTWAFMLVLAPTESGKFQNLITFGKINSYVSRLCWIIYFLKVVCVCLSLCPPSCPSGLLFVHQSLSFVLSRLPCCYMNFLYFCFHGPEEAQRIAKKLKQNKKNNTCSSVEILEATAATFAYFHCRADLVIISLGQTNTK